MEHSPEAQFLEEAYLPSVTAASVACKHGLGVGSLSSDGKGAGGLLCSVRLEGVRRSRASKGTVLCFPPKKNRAIQVPFHEIL